MNTATKQHRAARGLALAAGALALAVAVGCADQPPIAHGEDFTVQGQPTPMGRFAQAQAASGARTDATLCPQHFQGQDLNSLGQVKLDLMLRAAPANTPVVVYVDLPHSTAREDLAACKLSVTNYLVDAGVPQGQIQLVEGPNPSSQSPTAYALPEVYKPDGSTYTGTATDALGAGELNAVGNGSIGSH